MCGDQGSGFSSFFFSTRQCPDETTEGIQVLCKNLGQGFQIKYRPVFIWLNLYFR